MSALEVFDKLTSMNPAQYIISPLNSSMAPQSSGGTIGTSEYISFWASAP